MVASVSVDEIIAYTFVSSIYLVFMLRLLFAYNLSF